MKKDLMKGLVVINEVQPLYEGEEIYAIGYICDHPGCRKGGTLYDIDGVPMWFCDDHRSDLELL